MIIEFEHGIEVSDYEGVKKKYKPQSLCRFTGWFVIKDGNLEDVLWFPRLQAAENLEKEVSCAS